jgi:hypothetical protein
MKHTVSRELYGMYIYIYSIYMPWHAVAWDGRWSRPKSRSACASAEKSSETYVLDRKALES